MASDRGRLPSEKNAPVIARPRRESARLDTFCAAARPNRNEPASPWEEIMAAEIDATLELARPAGRKMPTLVVADQQEIAGAGIEALLQAGGHNVIARCSHEDELLRFVEAHRPDIILLAKTSWARSCGFGPATARQQSSSCSKSATPRICRTWMWTEFC